MKNSINSPKSSTTNCEWGKCSFLEWGKNNETHEKPYTVNLTEILYQLLKGMQKKVGFLKGGYIFLKSLSWDMAFNKQKWQPEKFLLNNSIQEKFYREKFKEYLPFINVFNNLGQVMGENEADRFVANQMLPITLNMMKTKFHPVENIGSVEVWLKQAREYLGSEIEVDKGFESDIYLAKDKSEMKFHVTRCANMEILHKYGLKYTAAALCMGDHIAYHTVFPNLIFKRSHSISVGDGFCDHEFRIRTNADPVIDEVNYGDCYTVEGIRELVR